MRLARCLLRYRGLWPTSTTLNKFILFSLIVPSTPFYIRPCPSNSVEPSSEFYYVVSQLPTKFNRFSPPIWKVATEVERIRFLYSPPPTFELGGFFFLPVVFQFQNEIQLGYICRGKHFDLKLLFHISKSILRLKRIFPRATKKLVAGWLLNTSRNLFFSFK